jgi:beta-xylosidase
LIGFRRRASLRHVKLGDGGDRTEPEPSAGGGVRLATDPVYPGDFPDPFVLRSGKRYYAYATQAGAISVQVMQSKDLATWTDPVDALPELPSWAGRGHTWAPAVLPRRRGYVLYYTVRHRASGRQCISVATATHPEGPFADISSEPLVFQQERGGSIDPSPFVDRDGRAYLLWKSDDNALRRPTSLWAAPLRSDGLALVGPAYQLLVQDAAWEAPVIEGPALLRMGDRYYLFYGGGWWESERSAIGYATADAPLGPYVKSTRDRPWLASRAHAAGPAGPQFFTDENGQVWIAYHAWEPGRVGYAAGGVRSLWLDRIGFTDGRPVLGWQSSTAG